MRRSKNARYQPRLHDLRHTFAVHRLTAWYRQGVDVQRLRAVKRPRLLEFTWLPDWQEPQTLVRFDLEEKDGVTTVRLTHSGFTSADSRDRYQGWPWLLALLQAYVETEVSG